MRESNRARIRPVRNVQPLRGLFLEGKSHATPPPDSQGADQRVFKGPGSIPESDDSVIDLLLVLNLERVGRQHHLNVVRDFLPRPPVKPPEDPHHFEDRDQADESGVLLVGRRAMISVARGDCTGSSCAKYRRRTFVSSPIISSA